MWTIPLIVFLGVFLHQRSRVRTIGQSAWKGGGFGMFSEIERSFVVTDIAVRTEHGSPITLRVPRTFGADVGRVPTRANLFAHARKVAEQPWLQAGAAARRREAGSTASALQILSVSVAHLRLEFCGASGRYETCEVARSPYRLIVKAS